MKNILEAPFLVEMVRTTTNMYDHTWDERNGGNISLMLDEAQVAEYLDVNAVLRTIPTGFTAPELDGKYFLVTGTGKYFKNVQYAPEVNLGIVRLKDQGQQADLLWGFADGNCVESVLMQYAHGYTICISTQVGCRMGCVFCASTIGSKIRDLTPGEILEQVICTVLV